MHKPPLLRVVVAAGLALAVGSATGCKDDDGFLAVPWDDLTLPSVPTATVPAPTGTPTATPSPVASPAPTLPPGAGPVITFFGIARADDNLIEPAGFDGADVPIYTRTFGSGFRIVIEAAPGSSGRLPGASAFEPDGTTPPALQIASSRTLGNGSPEVCDRTPPEIGGVPAHDPPTFASTPEVLAVLNDLGCRFLDGGGDPRGRNASVESCVQVPSDSGTYGFVAEATRMQFCALVDTSFAFPPGDTRLTVRLLDDDGNPGPAAQLILRVPG